MKRLLATFLCCFLLGALYAQEVPSEQENPDNGDENSTSIDNEFVYTANQEGDFIFKINIAASLPVLPEQLDFGLDLSIGVLRFFTPHILLGADATFSYNVTVASNFFYAIPVMGRFTYQFSIGKFEIPLSLGVGGTFEMYAERFYFGLSVEPEIGCYYRFNQEWSIGLFGACAWYPQWYTNPENNGHGVIATCGVSFRYHF